MINFNDRGLISEAEMTPIKSDPISKFASDEDLLIYHHFYAKAKEELRAKIQGRLNYLEGIGEGTTHHAQQYRRGVYHGLETAKSMLS